MLILELISAFILGGLIIGLYMRSQLLVARTEIKTLTKNNEAQALNHKNIQDALKNEFSVLAQKIFDEKSQKFTLQNKTNLEGLLNPLKEKIQQFEKQVHDTYDKESKDRLNLFHEIKHLKELNHTMHEDAKNLTQALKGKSQVQGSWGEMVLTELLEASGLTRDQEYELQVNIEEEGKRFRPDAIVHLPENRVLVVDAKVSLTAYERYCSAEQLDEKNQALKEHIQSVSEHIAALSRKEYQQLALGEQLDFVFLFIPIEAALSLVLSEKRSLYTESLEKNVVLVTPLTLIATLRTVYNLWRRAASNKNAELIAEKAGLLYDKFVLLANDLEVIGQRIDQLDRTYQDVWGRMKTGRGNLIDQANKLKALGAKTSKQLLVE